MRRPRRGAKRRAKARQAMVETLDCSYPTVSAKIDKLPKILAASRRMGRVAAVCYSVLRYWGVEENYVAAAPHADAIASSADACAQNHFLAIDRAVTGGRMRYRRAGGGGSFTVESNFPWDWVDLVWVSNAPIDSAGHFPRSRDFGGRGRCPLL